MPPGLQTFITKKTVDDCRSILLLAAQSIKNKTVFSWVSYLDGNRSHLNIKFPKYASKIKFSSSASLQKLHIYCNRVM
jgi:hypothetical protein